jgi:outer membrane receptor for Fe3+-dicitrate
LADPGGDLRVDAKRHPPIRATSIREALRLVPGVEVARIDSDHWAIGIRGFESGFSQSLLVLIDGQSVSRVVKASGSSSSVPTTSSKETAGAGESALPMFECWPIDCSGMEA